MMAARLLAKAGLEVTTLLLGSQYELKGDAATAWRELSRLSESVFVRSEFGGGTESTQCRA